MSREQIKKLNLKIVLTVLLLAILLIFAVFLTTSIMGRPYDRTNNTYKSIKISNSENIEEIAETLHDKKIISNESSFKFLSTISLKNGKYKTGTYMLSPCMNFNEITQTIIKGVSTNSGFTIPGGYNLEQLATALNQSGFIDKNEFIKMATSIDYSNFDFIDSSIDKKHQLDGFLLPGTYKMDPNANEIMIITTMLDSFDNFFNDEYKARADELNMSIRDVVILASLIEKETTVDKEKAHLSGIFHNKINLGLDFEGGYPKNPVCFPGEKSIEATLYPEDSDDIYYVLSDKLDGSHAFTSDESEYKALKKAYKKAKKEKEKSQEK